MNKKVSFAERLAEMQTAVTSLRAILEIVEREASAMVEVQQRFAAKKPAQKHVLQALNLLGRLEIAPYLALEQRAKE